MAEPDDGVPIDNEVDEHEDRPIDRMIHNPAGVVAGAAMTGLAKGMGMWVEPEEVAVIREAGAPPRDPDDPIEVSIDPDHPENTRIVYHLHPSRDALPVVAEPAARVWPPPPQE